MDKKVYNKPSLKLEIFTPNEYIASCWFIDEGDCYKYLYIDDNAPNGKINHKDTRVVYEHTHSGKVPSGDNTVFKTHGDTPISPEPITNVQYYYHNTSGDFNVSNTYLVTSLYKVTYNQEVHYFKKITYAERKGMS